MQQKKRSASRATPAHPLTHKGPGMRRPVGVQALGTVRYEELRRALHQLGVVAEPRARA